MSENNSTARRWFGALVGLLLAAALGFAGFQLWQRYEEITRQNAELSRKATQSAEAAKIAAEQASQASALATEAAKQANVAEASRQVALNEKAEAEKTATAAGQQAAAAQSQAAAAQSEVARMQREREEELNRMTQILNRIVETRRTSSGLVMNLSDKALHFEFDSANLSPQSRELLSRVAGILLASGGFGLAIHGHTDDVGTAEYNTGLSERRAAAVKEYLGNAGLERGIMSVKGFGKSSPMVQGHDELARARNRRVEIVLTDTKIKFLGEAR